MHKNNNVNWVIVSKPKNKTLAIHKNIMNFKNSVSVKWKKSRNAAAWYVPTYPGLLGHGHAE